MKLERLLGYPDEPRTVDDLRDRGYNFDPARLADLVAARGWHHDDRRQALPREPPGEPVPGGSFERAVALMRDYAFAEGSAVRAIFAADAPLEGRDMLLIGRFAGLDFRLGVRVTHVVDARPGEERGGDAVIDRDLDEQVRDAPDRRHREEPGPRPRAHPARIFSRRAPPPPRRSGAPSPRRCGGRT